MNVKLTARQQRQRFVDTAAEARIRKIWKPRDGWITTVRNALGMSGAELARRLGVSRESVRKAEQNERAGVATLKTLQTMADAMGCRLVYAIVPSEGRIEELIKRQARKKAIAIVGRASGHMALEDQALPHDRNEAEIERLATDLSRDMSRDFWSE